MAIEQVLAVFAEEADELLRRVERLVRSAGPAGVSKDDLLAVRRTLHTLKGSAAAVGAAALEQGAHELEDRLRTLERAGASAAEVEEELLVRLDALRSHMPVHAPSTEGPRPARPGVAPSAPPAPEPTPRADHLELLRVPPERVDHAHTLVGDLMVARLQWQSASDHLVRVREQCTSTVDANKQLLASLVASKRNLPEGVYKGLHESVHRALAAARLAAREAFTASRGSAMALSQTGAVLTDLEVAIRELRLMPLEPFFEEFGRTLRDAARSSGKKVKLVIRAGGAEVDRAVLARLREPMLHLVRNAVVHGIESPETRTRLGKDEVGTVLLEARSEGGRAYLRVVDDGAGVDERALRARANALGVCTADRVLDPEELLRVITHPGLSTHDRTDRLAGRGVGLDVVATVVRELNGHLRLDTMPGAGTGFTLEVPITASTGTGLLVEVAGQRFAVPLSSIDRILRVAPGDVSELDGRDTVRVGTEVVSLVSLADLLGFEAKPSFAGTRRPALLLRSGRQGLLLLVDDVIGEQQMVIKPLHDAFAGIDVVVGGAVQADHGILLVLSVPVLFQRAAGRPKATSPNVRVAVLGKRPRDVEVLVVDDSITMRTLERNILAAAGYAVRVAHDGISALESMQRHGMPDLLIADLEMPRMDGIELCRAVRGSSSPNTPIVMVTSVEDPLQKERALAAGADAYIVKNLFEQDAFLELVARLGGVDFGAAA